DRDVVTLITQVMVDKEDPGFRNPTKPGNGEIRPEIERGFRVVYYDQIKYGVYIRMALLCIVLERMP
ncbi:MAG: hypothetical protein LUQ65_04645, partial [Candidatus Helarchaeota archaeon]|nr:hypothetical protein [Candidatus Helarchaeota archaeon]